MMWKRACLLSAEQKITWQLNPYSENVIVASTSGSTNQPESAQNTDPLGP